VRQDAVGTFSHVMGIAADEREALCDLLLAVGPDQPTLCVGWSTADLAAHLLLRESRPDAAAGVVVPPLGFYTARVQARITEKRSYTDVVEGFRHLSGFWPTRLPGVDDVANGVELTIHHEDVRRAGTGWEPRALAPRLEAHLTKQLHVMGRLLLRRSTVGVRLETPDGQVLAHHRGKRSSHGATAEDVVVQGAPLELLLFAYGRRHVADVSSGGPSASLTTLAATPLGL
jgi:uncharacterized protein (TIGR03085 family)